MRFRSRFSQNSTTAVQRRLIALFGGVGACLILIQILAQGRVPALLTGGSADPHAETRHLKLRPNIGDEEHGDFTNLVRVTAAQERTALPAEGLEIDAELLEVIKDNSVGIRDSERDLYFMLLKRLMTESHSDMEKAARPIAFNVLMADSKKYLGQVLRVKGKVRRISILPSQADRDLPQFYEVWLFASDSGPNPYRIVCSSLPAELQAGDSQKSNPQVQVVGYYFKRYGYSTADGRLHVAPLLLAKTVQPQRSEQRTPRANPTSTFIVSAFGGLLFLLAIAWWRTRVGDREFERRFLKPLKDKADDKQ